MLQLYAHHPTAPAAPGERPSYHMTRLNNYAMTGNRQSFVEGATALRNMRDLAKRCRDDFIIAANTHERQANVSTNHANQYIATEGKGPSQSSSKLDNGNSSTSLAKPSCRTEHNSSKRSRQSRSPSSTGDSQLSKSRTRPSTCRRVTSISEGSGGRSSHWVTTYQRNGKLYIKDSEGGEIETSLGDWKEHALPGGSSCFYWEGMESGPVFWTTSLA
ncbi:hypothetical protein F4810DRAFT_677495 [Camillea tinctor]|nr:hypothetical protein F4810DRAFT_677495 [Camillea tinctor]